MSVLTPPSSHFYDDRSSVNSYGFRAAKSQYSEAHESEYYIILVHVLSGPSLFLSTKVVMSSVKVVK